MTTDSIMIMHSFIAGKKNVRAALLRLHQYFSPWTLSRRARPIL